MSIRRLTKSQKENVAARQYFKCAATVKDYTCPLWAKATEDKGCFGEEKYHIDHIHELWEGGDDSEDNLQALCLSCHAVKTKRNSKERAKLRTSKGKTESSSSVTIPKQPSIQELFDKMNYYIKIDSLRPNVVRSSNWPERSFIYDPKTLPPYLNKENIRFFESYIIDIGFGNTNVFRNPVDAIMSEEQFNDFRSKFGSMLKSNFTPGRCEGKLFRDRYRFTLQDAFDLDKIDPNSLHSLKLQVLRTST